VQPLQMFNLTASVRMQGETVSSTFKTAGTYEYYCEPHQGAHIRCGLWITSQHSVLLCMQLY
jgi:plastocyanin